MATIKDISLALLIGICAISLGACSKSEEKKGSMEKTGKAIDDALDKAKKETGQLMEKAGEALKEAGEKVRESGEKGR